MASEHVHGHNKGFKCQQGWQEELAIIDLVMGGSSSRTGEIEERNIDEHPVKWNGVIVKMVDGSDFQSELWNR